MKNWLVITCINDRPRLYVLNKADRGFAGLNYTIECSDKYNATRYAGRFSKK